jgi:RNase H-fold protein (predicted Holliday junction resolvase)
MILGIDYGKSKIGIAVIDDKENTPALPVTILKLHPDHLFYDTLTEVLDDYTPTEIIIGNPYYSYSSSKEDKEEFENFVKTVEQVSKLKPILFEEVGTTKEAQHLVKDHPQKVKDDDAIAASIMLEAYAKKKKNASIS